MNGERYRFMNFSSSVLGKARSLFGYQKTRSEACY